MSETSPTLRSVSQRAMLILVGCNVAAGMLVAYVYGLGLVQPPSQPIPEPAIYRFLGGASARLALSMLLWAAVVVGGALISRRIDRQISHWYERVQEGASPSEVPAAVQRHVLGRALVLGTISLALWTLAGLVFGLLYIGSVRVALVISGVAGILSVGLAIPLVDVAWRPIVPAFFPDGRPSTVAAWRLPVLGRLLLAMLLVGLYPTGLLVVASLTGAAALAGAEEPEYILNRLIALNGVLVGVSVVTAVVMALSVTRCMVRPLMDLQGAMDRVEQRDFTAHATVETNDELGHIGERFNDMVAGLRRGEVVRRLLDQYVSPAVAQQAVASGAELGGGLVHCTVLFADMRGFTGLSERLAPEELVALLNRFMGALVDVVVAHGGLINRFGGDSLLAVFGTPLNQCENHAASAVRAALDIAPALEDLNSQVAEEGNPPLRVGIGIATGAVVAGNIGGRERIEYTVIGAAVNLASRLEALTSEVGAHILLHADTYAEAVQAMALGARVVGPLPIRGFTEPVTVFAL